MEYLVLGPLEVRLADRVLPLRGARQRQLLAALLLNANQVVSTDRLIHDLWAGAPPPTATKIIQNAVSQLRKLLEPEAEGQPGRLITQSPGYLLRIEPGELDVHRFEQLFEEGRRELASGAPAVAGERLDEALGLWRGRALADIGEPAFARNEAARLEELRLAATEERIEAELALGRHHNLVPELEGLVANHPLRERLRGQLILALYRSGRQAEALKLYQETRKTLVDELGLEPSPALQRLERAVLQQDAALELSPENSQAVARPAAEPKPPDPETRKTVSVVFADVLLLAGPHDPEVTTSPIRRAVQTVVDVLERHGAKTEEVTGDAVLGVFGVPVVHEDDALRSVRAAVEAREAIAELTPESDPEAGVALGLRLGVNTGEVIAHGNDHAVAGEAVNLAARLRQTAQSGEILLGEQTERLVRGVARTKRVKAPTPAGIGTTAAWKLLDLDAEARTYPRGAETPMVGRTDELAGIHEAFARAKQEQSPSLFTVLGPAGVGKSRLATEFADAVGAEAGVLTAHCLSYGEGITFWPLAEVIRQLTGDRGRSALLALLADEEDPEAIVTRLEGAIGLADSTTATEETFWAARKLFEALARARPLVLVLDDLHWAEPTFLDLVEHVVEWSTAPIFVLGLSRPELLDARPRWAGGRAGVISIVLEPLSTQEAKSLIAKLLGDVALAPEAEERIAAAAEGNPFFIEQMLAMLAEGEGPDRELGVPPTIQALLAARLERLDADERAALQCASVIGREFSRTALVHLYTAPEREEVDAALGKLVRRELLRPGRSRLVGGEPFRFQHLLLVEAAYDSLPKRTRADLHERFADWLEGAADDRVAEYEEILGYHLERAYVYRAELGIVDGGRALAGRASARLAAAGRRAYSRGDLQAATGLLSRAAGLLEQGAAGHLELLADLGEALRETGEFERAERVIDEVIASASAAGDQALEARGLLIRLRLRMLTGPEVMEEVVEETERLIESFGPSGDDRLLAKAWELLAWAPWFRCQAAAAAEALRRATEHARRAGDTRTEAQSLNLFVGAAFFGPMPVSEAIELCDRIVAEPGQQGRITASALRALAGLKAMAGSFGEARELVAWHRAMVQELGLRVTAASAAETYGIVELLAGDAVAAEREFAWGFAALEEIGEANNFPDLAAKLAQALYAQGEDDAAFAFSEVSEQASTPDDLSAGVQWRAVRAKVLARRGDVDQAEGLARAAVELAEETDFLVLRGDALMDLSEVLRAHGDSAEATAAVEQALELYEQKGNLVSAAGARELLGR